jgi:hypothetical protein
VDITISRYETLLKQLGASRPRPVEPAEGKGGVSRAASNQHAVGRAAEACNASGHFLQMVKIFN